MNSFTFKLPKIAPNVYRREKVQAWLEFHADVALRYVTAPAGSGKTTAIVLYARSRAHCVGYVGLWPEATPTDLYIHIAQTTGLASLAAEGDYADLVRRLAAVPRVEIVIDNVDDASADVRRVLQRLYCDVADSVTFVYLARSPEALAFDGNEGRGLVALADPALLTFRDDEIALYAQSLGLHEDSMSIARLQRCTQGWTAAVAGICLYAAANRSCLRESWMPWRRLAQRSLNETVADALHLVPAEVASKFNRIRAGELTCDDYSLRLFARYGLFIHERGGSLSLNPLIASSSEAGPCGIDGREPGPAIVEMFGRFTFAIDGKEPDWRRRRDRQIIAYLAMQGDGRSTRSELISTFWPEADPQLASQSLRTACSTIRRAFAACVGAANVSRYFNAEHFVELKLDAVVNSVSRFQSHIANADRAFESGDVRAAYAHYCAAEKLYIAPFLAGEPPTDWGEMYAAQLDSMHQRAAERLDVLAGRITSDDAGRFSSILGGEMLSA